MASPTGLDFPKRSLLTHRGVIYIPSTTDRNNPISKSELDKRVTNVSRQISETFGGNTVQRFAYGSWIGDDGKPVNEDIVRVEFFATKKDYLANDHKIGRMIRQLAKKWGQDTISYEYQSPKRGRALHFVSPLQRKRLEEMM